MRIEGPNERAERMRREEGMQSAILYGKRAGIRTLQSEEDEKMTEVIPRDGWTRWRCQECGSLQEFKTEARMDRK